MVNKTDFWTNTQESLEMSWCREKGILSFVSHQWVITLLQQLSFFEKWYVARTGAYLLSNWPWNPPVVSPYNLSTPPKGLWLGPKTVIIALCSSTIIRTVACVTFQPAARLVLYHSVIASNFFFLAKDLYWWESVVSKLNFDWYAFTFSH